MRMTATFCGFAILALSSAATHAANWQTVTSAEGALVEIDKSSVMRTAQGLTVAWSRRKFDREERGDGIRYTAMLTMDRYDCTERHVATVKRVYLLHGKVVREERIPRPKRVAVGTGGYYEALIAEACKPRTVSEAQQTAAAAVAAARQAESGVLQADTRTAAGGKTPAKSVAVADKQEAKADAAETKPAGTRPQFIELPKIDKSKVEDPFADMKPAQAKPAATTAAATAKPAPKRADKRLPSASRREIERQYATSGPRKPAVKRRRTTKAPAKTFSYVPWSYEGAGAPANWAKLRPDYAACGNGRRQSPIDIRDGIGVDLEPIGFDYVLSQFRIIDTGHTIQVNLGEGSTMTIMGRTYRLVQFHFHRPAEERIHGRRYDMDIQFVHEDDDGHLAIVTVLLDKGAVENPVIQTLWNNLPLEVGQDVAPTTPIELKTLLPEDRAYYTYMGSLTTPPCTEDVLWMVFKQPIQISAEQVGIFAHLYKHNARPIQPSNGRLIKMSR